MERLVYNVVSGTPIPIASCVNRSQIFSTFYFESTNNAQLLAIDSINYYWFCQSFVNQMQLLCWKRFKMLISHRALLLSLSRYVTNGVVCVCAVRQRFSAVRYQYIDIYQVTYANGRPH